jgi:hypothetical protein
MMMRRSMKENEEIEKRNARERGMEIHDRR